MTARSVYDAAKEFLISIGESTASFHFHSGHMLVVDPTLSYDNMMLEKHIGLFRRSGFEGNVTICDGKKTLEVDIGRVWRMSRGETEDTEAPGPDSSEGSAGKR